VITSGFVGAKRLLITGASGLLGLNFAMQAAGQQAVTGVVHHNELVGVPFSVVQADLARPQAVEDLLERTRPEVVIHCAALANLEACETQPELAWRLNAVVPGELAAATAAAGIKLVHISTDAIFDGLHGDYKEEDRPNPLGVYARSKLAGEQGVMQANPQAIIARVNFYGWSLNGTRSLAEFFYRNLSAGKNVNGFTDVFFCPLLVNQLVELLIEMVEKDLKGLYHVVSSEHLSKYEFGCRIARLFDLDERLITPTTWEAGGLQAQRSPNLIMCTDKLARDLGYSLPDQQDGLRRFRELFDSGYPQEISLFRRLVV
jgi:dTDP-4-dehydrorhamnose reductase